MKLRLTDIATWVGGRLHGAGGFIEGVSTDTRTLSPAALFVALKGERYDAHDFVGTAHERGATAALVDHVGRCRDAADHRRRHARGARRTRARGALAARRARDWHHRIEWQDDGEDADRGDSRAPRPHARQHRQSQQRNRRAADAARDARACAVRRDRDGRGQTRRHRVSRAHRAPDIGLVNNVAPAHLERLGSERGVAETKGAIYAALAGGWHRNRQCRRRLRRLFRRARRRHAASSVSVSNAKADDRRGARCARRLHAAHAGRHRRRSRCRSRVATT